MRVVQRRDLADDGQAQSAAVDMAAEQTVEALEDEVARLREALQRSQMREEILKKSLGIFVEPPGSPSPSSRR